MNVGDGLTLQTQLVDGKNKPGIFLATNSTRSLNRTQKFNKTFSQNRIRQPAKQKLVGKRQSQQAKPQERLPQEKSEVLFFNNNSPTNDDTKTASNPRNKNTASTDQKPNQKLQRSIRQNQAKQSTPEVPKSQSQKDSNTIKVDTKYVTLTQDQLNTILNLVKVKQEIDISKVLKGEKGDKENSEPAMAKTPGSNDDKGKVVAPDSIPGLDFGESKGQSDEEKTPGEEPAKDAEPKADTSDTELNEEEKKPEKREFSTLMGMGSRDRERSRLERRRKEWLDGLDEQLQQKQKQKSNSSMKSSNPSPVPMKVDEDKQQKSIVSQAPKVKNPIQSSSAVNFVQSSFFLGEAPPNYTDMKRQSQQKWKEELDKQLKEQENEKLKRSQENKRSSSDETTWTKHFDTFQPQTKGNEAVEEVEVVETPTQGDVTARTNHLRTMRSLLDPAEVDALEIRRQRQQEHRKAIAEQVEEKRKLKERETFLQKQEEEMEEKRLEEDRKQLQRQFESERNRQLALEEKRERQTQELYQQMEAAKESAHLEKMQKRHRTLREHGHDTSRLKTNQHGPRAAVSDDDFSTVQPELTAPFPSAAAAVQSSSAERLDTTTTTPAPISLLANTAQGAPIRLEISLNPSTGAYHFMQPPATATDRRRTNQRDESLRLDFGSDDETEYLPLPPRQRREQKAKQNATVANVEKASTKLNERPKWGVGKKTASYTTASDRYVGKRPVQDRNAQLKKNARRNQELQAQGEQSKISSTERLKAQQRNEEERRRRDRAVRQQRPNSPPVPSIENRMKSQKHPARVPEERSESALSVTTDFAKYKASRHSPSSPVPDANDFVEYRRSEIALDPNKPQSRNPSALIRGPAPTEYAEPQKHNAVENKDPLLNSGLVKQPGERQEKILREISILRQGLLLKQREVASYPVAMATTGGLLANLPERVNDSSSV